MAYVATSRAGIRFVKDARSRLLKGALWIGLTRVLVNAIGFVSTIILARLLVPEDFGLVAIASSVAAIFASVSELSLSQALIQHNDPKEEHFDSAFSLNALRALLLAAIIAAIGWPAAIAYDDDRLIGVMAGFAIANLVGGFLNPRLALLERNLEFRQWIILSGGEKLAGFIVSATIAFVYQSYWALVVGVVASQAIRVLASYLLVPHRPRFSLECYRELLSFSIWLTLGQIVQAINWRADPLLLGAFLPTKAIGHFSMGSRVSTMAVGEVLQPVSKVLFPAFSRIKDNPWRLREGYLRAQGLMALIALPIGVGLAALAAPLVTLLLGTEWAPAIPVVQFLAIAAAVQHTNQLNAIGMATGNTRALFFRDLRALFVRLPLILGGMILGPMVGVGLLTGAIMGHVASSSINALLNMHLVARISQVKIREHLALLWRPALASAAMAAAIAGIAPYSPFPNTLFGSIGEIALSGVLGGLVYIAVLILLWLAAGRPQGPEMTAANLISKRVKGFSVSN